MSNENELLEPLATEAGQQAIVRAIRDMSSLEYAVRAERAATNAAQSADEALNSAEDASDSETMARNWATKMDGAVAQETITIPPEQEGDDPTTETINFYSARYYAALAQDIYNNMQFDSVPTENSTNMVNSGTVYSALNLKADKSTTYTKTETDALINTKLAELVSSAPATLDTLQELATALGNDPNFATTVATQLGNKADKSTTYTKTEVDTLLADKADSDDVQTLLTFDDTPTANSDNPVKSGGIKTALDGKQDSLTFDSTPTENSTNPVTSGGVYTALQNVNIDIDDEITEDSDNPVTSAAIYEALQNFTPSGGGGAGNASGMVREELWSGTLITQGDVKTLSNSILEYDFIEVVYFKNNWQGNPLYSEIFSVQQIKETENIVVNSWIDSGQGFQYSFPSNTTIKMVWKTSGASNYYIKQVNGIKFSKNLSEQMYSNVLYENSSGVGNGTTITLSDSYKNYDFLEAYSKDDAWAKKVTTYSTPNELGTTGLMYAYNGGNKWVALQLTSSDTQLSVDASNDSKIYKIIGYKMAKGGYSGIVSDARMTVKSGTYTYNQSISSDISIQITFDSPMPDTNYQVFLNSSGGGAFSTYAILSSSSYTVNGFNINVRRKSSDTIQNSLKIDWIAIRPNSYTREGMVEDVLFSNASGVNSGTINLSGNISDYDLLCFSVIGANEEENHYTNVSQFIQRNSSDNYYLITGYDNYYVRFYYSSDTSITFPSQSGTILQIGKITGIKFGRYVSGVAVDTTVTQNSDAVVTSGAVYDALQNIPSGGGGGSITIDSVPTENSQNAVSSGGVYDALQSVTNCGFDIPSDGIITISSNPSTLLQYTWDEDYIIAEAGALIGTIKNKNYYKTNSIPAIFGFATIDNYCKFFLVSDKQDGVISNSEGSGSWVTDDGITLYYAYGDGSLYQTPTNQYGGHQNWIGGFGYNQNLNAAKGLFNMAKTGVIQNQSYDISQTTAKSIIQDLKPIIINNNVFYPLRYIGGDYYYFSVKEENNNTELNVAIINSQWQLFFHTLSGYSGSSITVDSTITQGGTNPVEGGAIYTALGDKADKSTTYTKTEVDTAVASKGDVTTDTNQNITGTKTFVGSKKIAFKQSAANDKLGFTLYGNTGTERGYLEFNPTNTVDGVTGLMTLGNYATSAAALTQVGFRRYSNISGASGAYNLLMPMVADARTPFSLTTTYQNFYLPLGFTDGTTTVKTAKSGLVDLSPLLASLESRIAALEGN